MLDDFFKQYPDKKREYTFIAKHFADSDKPLKDFFRLIERLSASCGFLGKTVEVTMDRPIGSPHPKHSEIRYPINYGYIDGVLGGDGEEQDVYILDLCEPTDVCKATIAAVIHRLDDVEDKLVAVTDGSHVSVERILDACSFQEKYYHSQIIINADSRVYKGFDGIEEKITR